MFRMANEDKFAIDYEVGRPTVRKLGAFRPFIGAIFGVAMCLISSGLASGAPGRRHGLLLLRHRRVLAGFAERRTKVILGSAEGDLEKSDEPVITDGRRSPTTRRDRARAWDIRVLRPGH